MSTKMSGIQLPVAIYSLLAVHLLSYSVVQTKEVHVVDRNNAED